MRFTNRTFRYAFLLPVAYAVGVACATSSEPNEPAGPPADASVIPNLTDSGTSPPFDAGSFPQDTGLIPPGDATVVDSTPPVTGACTPPLGNACDPEAPFGGTCGFFVNCEEWKNPVIYQPDAFADAQYEKDAGDADTDAAVDAGAANDAGADVDAGPPLDGLCVPVNFQRGDCNGFGQTCEAGTWCLLKAGICLTPQEAECICGAHPAACAYVP